MSALAAILRSTLLRNRELTLELAQTGRPRGALGQGRALRRDGGLGVHVELGADGVGHPFDADLGLGVGHLGLLQLEPKLPELGLTTTSLVPDHLEAAGHGPGRLRLAAPLLLEVGHVRLDHAATGLDEGQQPVGGIDLGLEELTAVRGGVACQSKPALTNSCLVKYLGGVQIDNGQGVAVEAAGSNKRLVAFNNDVERQVGKFDLSACWCNGPSTKRSLHPRHRGQEKQA